MARIAGKTAAQTVDDMRRAATRLIREHGFEGMNLRMLADAIGVQPGSFYNHIRNKQELLFMLLSGTMDELLRELEIALEEADDPVDALQRFVTFHIEFHANRKAEVFIGNAELRSLTPANLKKIVAMRNAYEERLVSILVEGRSRRLFTVADPKIAAYALIAMLTGVCTWYRPGGRLTVPMLVRQYRAMALGAVGAKVDGATRASSTVKPGGATKAGGAKSVGAKSVGAKAARPKAARTKGVGATPV